MSNDTANPAFWRFLGLAVKAGRVVTGNEAVEIGIRHKKGFLVIIAGDAASGSAEKIIRVAQTAKIPVISAGCKSLIGHWTGKIERAAALVTDKGFAERLIELSNRTDLNKRPASDKNEVNIRAEAK